MQQTTFNILIFGYNNLQVCQFILRFNKLEMQNDKRDNKNGNRKSKNQESRELSQSLSAVRKRKQGKHTTKFIKAEAERKRKKTEKSGND